MADHAQRAPKGRRDPYWDMEGKHARRDRHTRMVVELVAFGAFSLLRASRLRSSSSTMITRIIEPNYKLFF